MSVNLLTEKIRLSIFYEKEVIEINAYLIKNVNYNKKILSY